MDYEDTQKQYFIGILAKNEPDVLTRVVEIFGLNNVTITSLTADMVDPENDVARITVEISAFEEKVEKICSMLRKISLIYRAEELGFNGLTPLQRDFAFIKFTGDNEERSEAIRMVNRYSGRLVDFTENSIIFEVVKEKEELYHLVTILEVLGEVEYAKTGTLAITRGDEKFSM